MEDSELALDDSLQVEWAKSQAWKECWEAEVLIIQEEMRRVIMYQQWHALWWWDQGKRRTDADSATLHGVSAYAEKQASLCESLARACAICWLPALKAKGITPDWATIGLLTKPISHVTADENRTLEDEESDESEESEMEEIDDVASGYNYSDDDNDADDNDNDDSFGMD